MKKYSLTNKVVIICCTWIYTFESSPNIRFFELIFFIHKNNIKNTSVSKRYLYAYMYLMTHLIIKI